MHPRVLLAVAAWLVGASAATGSSLLAVSVLGQSMNPAAGTQLGVEAVNHTPAKKAAERAAAKPRRPVPPSATPTTAPSSAGRHPASPRSPDSTGGSVLTSQGGTLVASCAGTRAYLVSWSPQPGFGSSGVVRGPATNARVTFTSGQLTVTMVVSCAAGVPTATPVAVSAWSGAANTWGGDGE